MDRRAVLLLGTHVPFAHAQEEEPEPARIHFMAGRARFDAGRYEQALVEFESALRLRAADELHYNIYLCHERLGHFREAAESLATYLSSVDNADDRHVLESRLEALRERAAQAEEEASAEPPPAARAPLDGPSSPTDSESDGSVLIPISGVLLGLAGASAVAWAVLAGLSASEHGTLTSGCGVDGSCSDAEVSDLRTYSTGADVALTATSVLGAAGLVMLIVALAGTSDDGAVGARPCPAGVCLEGAF